MNYSEHTMRASSVTRDRRTINQGWAGFHARRPALPVRLWRRWSRALGWLCTFGLLGFIGILLAARG
jgi:hypothetical protein